MQSHNHNGLYFNSNKVSLNSGSGGYQLNWLAGAASDQNAFTTNSKGGGDSENLQPYQVINYIVKS